MSAPILAGLAQAALQRYPAELRGTCSLLCLSENATFRIDAAGGRRYVLRVHRSGYHDRNQIASELAWLDALQADGLEVPHARPGLDGERIQEIAGHSPEPRFAVLFDWIEGAQPDPERSLDAAFARLGAINARLHNQARRWARPAGFDRKHWTHRSMLGEGAYWGRWEDAPYLDPEGRALIVRTLAALAPALAEYDRLPGRHGLIHADLRLANLLVEGEHTRVIDFDDCGFSWYLHDLAAALSFYEHHPDADHWIAHWLDGYAREASLDAADLAALPSLIMQRRLQLLAWVGSHQGTEQADSLGEPWVRQTLALCSRYLDGRGVGSRT